MLPLVVWQLKQTVHLTTTASTFRMQYRRDMGELQFKTNKQTTTTKKKPNKTKTVACELQKEESTHCIASSANIDDLQNKDFKGSLGQSMWLVLELAPENISFGRFCLQATEDSAQT